MTYEDLLAKLPRYWKDVFKKDGVLKEGVDLILEGYKCRIWRNPHAGNLCGYVFLPDSSSLYEARYTDDDFPLFCVHGGINFSSWLDGQWAIGFDCAHAWDMVPARDLHPEFEAFFGGETVYRDREYVQKELENLCKQLKEWECK